MLETKHIINAIGVLNNLNKMLDKDIDILLKVKNSETGEILGFNYNYVADETLFIFASKEGKGTCNDYLRQLEGESNDECWNDYALANMNLNNDTDEILTSDDLEEMDEEELAKERYEVVTSLLTRVYVGDLNECPIKCFNKSFEIKDIQIIGKDLVLIY